MNDQRLGTAERPLRAAVVGSGPSGFYAAEHLQARDDLVVEVDMFDRLPTPFGLVRGGVAPDHQKIKSVTRAYDKIAGHPAFRFYGNVELGRDIEREDLLAYYHAVIYAVGARSDRRMGIPREHLPGSHSATEFVGWYNAHPDFQGLSFDLSGEVAVVVGNGNVAMDVARILASSPDALAATDIADEALDALRASAIRDIYVLGRRGPAQAAFTPKELRELGELGDADVIVDPAELVLDPHSREDVGARPDRNRDRVLDVLGEMAARAPEGRTKRIHLQFLSSPVEIIGEERVDAVRVVENELYRTDAGVVRPRPTDRTREIATHLVFRAIGYRGVALPSLPFDEWAGVVPNQEGRITASDTGEPLIGEYVVGWIKRGPQGVIGTNRPDAQETVEHLVEDCASGRLDKEDVPPRRVLERFVAQRRRDFVSYDDWRLIDAIEQEGGKAGGVERPRCKFASVERMLGALEERKSSS